MKITPNQIGLFLSQENVDDIANGLLLSPNDFSSIACLAGSLSGFNTWCNDCIEIEITSCIRDQIFRSIVQAQSKTEEKLGYGLSKQYKTARVKIPRGKVPQTLQIKDGFGRAEMGICDINVSQVFSTISSGEVSMFIQQDVNVEQNADGVFFAVIPLGMLENPDKIMLRNERLQTVQKLNMFGFPRLIDDEWHIPINNPGGFNESTVISAQHCELIYVDFEHEECNGSIHPVYPGSHQKIRFVRSEEIENGSRFWINAWDLVNPSFYNSGVDWINGEFHKLFNSIDLGCFAEVETPPVMYVNNGDHCYTDISEYDREDIQIRIEDSSTGIIRVEFNDKCCKKLAACPPYQYYEIEISYCVNPVLILSQSEMSTLQEALAYFVAATITPNKCNCEIKHGFIAAAQEEYQESRWSFAGQLVENRQYARLFGFLKYAEMIEGLYRRPKYTFVSG